jgi:hypothetical protein
MLPLALDPRFDVRGGMHGGLASDGAVVPERHSQTTRRLSFSLLDPDELHDGVPCLARPPLGYRARLMARQFTRNPRTADHAPGLPAESNARARQKRSALGSDVVENRDAVKEAWSTTVVENVFDLLT